jgi:GNAT superfamily N-acetyltransferase
MPSVTIRPAGSSDVPTIVRLVRELADFEGLADQVRITEADVLRDGFGNIPRFECLLVEIDGAAVGFALFFHTYSTFEGRPGIYLEDLYLAEAARGGGIGRLLLARLARIAVERGWPAARSLGAGLEPRARLLPTPWFSTHRRLAALPAFRRCARPPRRGECLSRIRLLRPAGVLVPAVAGRPPGGTRRSSRARRSRWSPMRHRTVSPGSVRRCSAWPSPDWRQ